MHSWWGDGTWPGCPLGAWTHELTGACRSLALESLAHPLLPFLLLFHPSSVGGQKSKNKRERAAIKMEKKGGSGWGGVPEYYQPKSWDGKGKGKRQRGRQPRQTDGASATEVWPATGCRGTLWEPLGLQPVHPRWRFLGRKARTQGAYLQFSTAFNQHFLSCCCCDEDSWEASVMTRVWGNDGRRQI